MSSEYSRIQNMADSSDISAPAGESDGDLQNTQPSQAEEGPGKVSDGKIETKVEDTEKGSDLGESSKESRSDGLKLTDKPSSSENAVAVPTPVETHNTSSSEKSDQVPAPAETVKPSSTPVEDKRDDNAVKVDQSENMKAMPDSGDSVAAGIPKPDNTGGGDTASASFEKELKEELNKGAAECEHSTDGAPPTSSGDASPPTSSGDASSSINKETSAASADTPNASGDASSRAAEEESKGNNKKKDDEKDNSSQDDVQSGTSSGPAANGKSEPESKKANSDVTSHSNKASTSPQTKDSSDAENNKDDGDVVIMDDDKSQPKKSSPVKQEPNETESKESQSKKGPRECIVCKQVGKCKYNIVRNGCTKHLCDDLCYRTFKQQPAKYLKSNNKTPSKSPPVSTPNNEMSDEKGMFCAACNVLIVDRSAMASQLVAGEVKDFCGVECKSRYVSENSVAAAVDDDDDEVEIVGTSNINSSKGKTGMCCVCMKQASIKHVTTVENQVYKVCSNVCFTTLSKQRGLGCELCEQCFKPCQKSSSKTQCIQFEGNLVHFCSTICLNVFKTTKQKIVTCSWCHAKKSNFDMVERIDGNSKCQVFCSLNCLSLYRVQLQATSQNNVTCDQCHKPSPAQYHLTMSDASVRNFCSYECVVQFQKQFMPPSNNSNLSTNEIHQNVAAKQLPVPPTQAKAPPIQPTRQSSRQATRATGKRSNSVSNVPAHIQPNIPVISNVISLAPTTSQILSTGNQTAKTVSIPTLLNQQSSAFGTSTYQVMIEQPSPVSMKNKGILCRPNCVTKATSCRPLTSQVGTQTDEDLSKPKGLLPVPIPIYVPVPMKMYHHPVPYPIPIPIPIPVPVFIPTTKKSANGILKHIQELQQQIPEDPFEAELLQMAEAVASADKTQESSDSEDDAGVEPASPARVDAQDVGGQMNSSLGEDLVQAAFRLSGFDQPVLDLEDTLEASCIDPEAPGTRVEYNNTENEEPLRSNRGGKRRGRGRGRGRPAAKKRKVAEDEPLPPDSPMEPPPPLPSDANFSLKFTYGVNAWTHWVIHKNLDLEKTNANRMQRYKTSLLACSCEELNKSLCLFVKEVRKPNGDEYAADSIFYLCLGIQQYLYENGRIDNIFTDWYFDKFTECLNDILATYEPKQNSYGLIVCRLEEEHLWECKQLGAHSPHVLLLTLIYFNTKFFMLRTPEEHLRLSFSHVVKHWKKSPIGGQGAGRSVYLKYYSPNQMQPVDNRKKREEAVSYEQMENADNPLRCPVKLYEFYLSKCPESIRNRSDVFYLVPERSCVPDSPVWYSTQNQTVETMTHLLNRVRVVREIQESFLLHPSPLPSSS